MTYSEFLFSQLFMNFCENNKSNVKELEYDKVYPLILDHYANFAVSPENTDKESEYDCMVKYIESALAEPEPEIKVTLEQAEEYFHSALCNGLGYLSGYGLELCVSPSAYHRAKKKLENPCYEDVLILMLKLGDRLTLVDTEEGEAFDGSNATSITLSDIHKRMPLTPREHLLDMINGQDDAITADVILQTVFFKEVIFG